MTLQELITDLKAAGANENTLQLAMNCYELGLKNATKLKPLTTKQRSAIAFAWRDGNGTASEIIELVEAAHGIRSEA